MIAIETFSGWIAASLLLSLRFGPVFVFAPPFSLIRTPPMFRVLLSMGLAILIVSANPDLAAGASLRLDALAGMALAELMFGISVVAIFQIAFGALYFAGRTLDIQAGFGLALLIDPTSRSQTPLMGTIFAFTAGAMFFAMNGHHDLLRLIAVSTETVPLGGWRLPESPNMIIEFISLVFLVGLAASAAAMLCLFLTDIAIALLIRTLPQMNALLLGLQVKTLVLLIVLPLSLGITAAAFMRVLTLALEYVPRMF
ncbi:MAG: flagellar biosynthetic protein FliR [Pseudomonadota bacterium]